MQHYDVRLKLILQEAMLGLLQVMELPGVVEYLTVEFPKRERALPDLVMRLVDGRILHIELQSKNDPRIAWRCLEYWQVISELWPGTEVIQVVLYLGDSALTMPCEIRLGRMSYDFQILDLKSVPAGAFLESANDSERILAVLCESEDPRATIKAILASWAHLPLKELQEKIERLSVLSQLRKCAIIVKEEVSVMPFDLEFDVRQHIFYMQGEERGISLGEAKTLTRLLERRFGPLPEAIQSRISNADIETLDRWVDRLDTISTLDALFV